MSTPSARTSRTPTSSPSSPRTGPRACSSRSTPSSSAIAGSMQRRARAGCGHGPRTWRRGCSPPCSFTFILQIVTRYVINHPLGWTLEACLTLWLWLVFWGGGLRASTTATTCVRLVLPGGEPRGCSGSWRWSRRWRSSPASPRRCRRHSTTSPSTRSRAARPCASAWTSSSASTASSPSRSSLRYAPACRGHPARCRSELSTEPDAT